MKNTQVISFTMDACFPIVQPINCQEMDLFLPSQLGIKTKSIKLMDWLLRLNARCLALILKIHF